MLSRSVVGAVRQSSSNRAKISRPLSSNKNARTYELFASWLGIEISWHQKASGSLPAPVNSQLVSSHPPVKILYEFMVDLQHLFLYLHHPPIRTAVQNTLALKVVFVCFSRASSHFQTCDNFQLRLARLYKLGCVGKQRSDELRCTGQSSFRIARSKTETTTTKEWPKRLWMLKHWILAIWNSNSLRHRKRQILADKIVVVKVVSITILLQFFQ